MKRTTSITCLCLLALAACLAPAVALAQAPTSISDVKAPQATVPEKISLQGEFVRVAYNNEGFVTLGYRVANGSVGEEWMMLDVGITVRDGVKSYDLKREALTLKTPDGKVNKACALLFFSDLGRPGAPPSFDQVDLTDNRACVGRLFFKVPGGIQTGQHWLVAKFAQSEVQVPFRILTKEEEKFLRKNWEDLDKALREGVVE